MTARRGQLARPQPAPAQPDRYGPNFNSSGDCNGGYLQFSPQGWGRRELTSPHQNGKSSARLPPQPVHHPPGCPGCESSPTGGGVATSRWDPTRQPAASNWRRLSSTQGRTQGALYGSVTIVSRWLQFRELLASRGFSGKSGRPCSRPSYVGNVVKVSIDLRLRLVSPTSASNP